MTISISALTAQRATAEFFAIPALAAAHDCDSNCSYCWGPETD